PAERAGALSPAHHQLLADPLLAQPLGSLPGRRGARGPDGALGVADELVLEVREPRLGLDVAPPGSGRVQLGLEVEVRLARGGAAGTLEHEPGALAGGVGRRDVDEVRVVARLAQRLQQARGTLGV